MIRFTTGDMFETPADLRVNTVNCVGVMGAGVAAAFKKRFPEMFKDYERECDAGRVQPGKLHIWKTLTGEWVVNFPTKRHWRDKSRYEDIEAGLQALKAYLEKQSPIKVTLPALGCGHGGLDWGRVAPMIEQHLGSVPAEISVFTPQDSHLHARQEIAKELGTMHTISAGSEGFPTKLRNSDVREIYSAGSFGAKVYSDIAIALSPKPTHREEMAALSVVQELARPGMSLAMTAGSSAANSLASTAVAQGAKVSFWVSEGLARYRLPGNLKSAFAEGNLSLFSVARAEQGWNPRLAAQNTVASLSSSSATVITDPQPVWLSAIGGDDTREWLHRLFYLRYQGADQASESRWSELAVAPIGRRSSDGKPNVTPLLEAIDHSGREAGSAQKKSADFGQQPVDSTKHLVQESPLVTNSERKSYPKRLIEVDLPIKRISAHARREKSIRHGHISTLHIWWARRPLAACRAVICASLWPDPVDPICPPAFLKEAKKQMLAWTDHEHLVLLSPESRVRFEMARQRTGLFDNHLELRHALLDFIADFANWDSSTVKEYLETSRALTQAAHEALGGAPGTRPLVVDPFAGGGSIPLEALRVGADAFASDLNPVPVMLNKVTLEYIPKYGQRLADEVRKWGEWIKQEAEKELAEFYPKDADGATPIAYLWARTIQCEGPGCGAEVPLIRSSLLASKAHRSLAVQLVPNKNAKRVDFRILIKERGGWSDQADRATDIENPKLDGTLKRGSATCPCCGYTTPVGRIRLQLSSRNGGANDARLFCVVTTRANETGRSYRLPEKRDLEAMRQAATALQKLQAQSDGRTASVPDEPLPKKGTLGFRVQNYGMLKWRDVFNQRQALTLSILSKLVTSVERKAQANVPPDEAAVIQVLLSISLNRLIGRVNSLCWWRSDAGHETIEVAFSGQTVPMKWDFAEACPLTTGTAGWDDTYAPPARVVENIALLRLHGGTAAQANATAHPLPDDSAHAFITDPPYYDAVPYAALSDFFYVWLKRTLPQSLANLFSESVAPKDGECIVDDASGKDRSYFEQRMAKAMGEGRRVLGPSGVGVIVFAHKSTAGWESQLQSMIDSGWIITGSWPIDTEQGQRIRARASAALASSVHLVCRPRENADGSVRTDEIGDWRDVLQELPKRIHEWMPRLADEGVVGADAIFACLGPALEVFSRYSRVEKASGEQVTLREYLEHVWAAVSKEALSSLIAGTDLSALDADARITAMWLWTLNAGKTTTDSKNDSDDEGSEEEEEDESKKSAAKGGYSLEYDAARKISQGLGASLEDLNTIIEVKGDQARLLPVSERTAYLFGKEQASAPGASVRTKKKANQMDLFAELSGDSTATEAVWEEKTVSKPGATVLDRVHQAMILFATGRGEALKRFLVDDGVGSEPALWKLAQALSALYPPGSQEKRWVDGVLARKKGLGL